MMRLPRVPTSVAVALAATILLGIALTLGTIRLEDRAIAGRLDRLADQLANNLTVRMAQHVALLHATRSYLEAENGRVTPTEFSRYVAELNLPTHAAGIQGIGYAAVIPSEDTAATAQRLSQTHGFPISIVPETDQPIRTPVALLAPEDRRNHVALGYDMLAEPVRRAAIVAARSSLDPRASGPVELVQEITSDKQAGFLIYLRARTGLDGINTPDAGGMVYAPFRAGDLHRAVLQDTPDLPVTLRSIDLGAPERPLFDNSAEADAPVLARRAVHRRIEVAGRQWQLTITPTAAFYGLRDHSAAIIVGGLSLLLLSAVGVAMDSLRRSLDAARRTAELARQQAADRALLLGEMQHRIKNHIARIQAIARQSLRSAADLRDFERIFGGRLSAMAKAQDALGRDGTARADLHQLLRGELLQVMDAGRVDSVLTGSAITLGEHETRAVGLVAHELVTNAVKYDGGLVQPGADADLRVSWQLTQRDGKPWLDIDWHEPHARVPASTDDKAHGGGFGSQLIEALVEGDLSGRFRRAFGTDGMHVTISFPRRDD